MKKSFVILLITISLSSCSKYTLDDTIFVHDQDNWNLPAYTELGYNSFGAQYERDYFLVSSKIVPCKISYKEELLYFALSGTIGAGKEMSLTFIFPSKQMNDYTDLLQLNHIEIDLSEDECIVIMKQDNHETILNIFYGRLFFKRAQILNIDDEMNRIILSGLFDLYFIENDFSTSIENGRFDLGITNKVFFSQTKDPI